MSRQVRREVVRAFEPGIRSSCILTCNRSRSSSSLDSKVWVAVKELDFKFTHFGDMVNNMVSVLWQLNLDS